MRILTASSNIWKFLFEFQTNSPASKTFDPSIYTVSAKDWLWKLGDGTQEISKAFSKTYADGTTKTVRVYCKKSDYVPVLVSFSLSDDEIVGVLDLSVFENTDSHCDIMVETNPSLTSVLFAPAITGKVFNLWINQTGVSELDLTGFSAIADGAFLWLHANPNLTEVVFNSSLTGKLLYLFVYSCNLTGTLDISMFGSLSDSAWVNVCLNPLLQYITLPASVSSGTLALFYAYSCDLQGTLDMSAYASLAGGADIMLYGNADLQGVTFPAAITAGSLYRLIAHQCDLQGTLDLSMFEDINNLMLWLHQNADLEGVTFPATVSGIFQNIFIYSCNLAGTLDISMFTEMMTGSAGSQVNVNHNAALQYITIPASVTGKIRVFDVSYCDLQGAIDLSVYENIYYASLQLQYNPDLTGVTFAAAITGDINAINIAHCNLTGTLDLSMFTVLSNAFISLTYNPLLTGVTFAASVSGTLIGLQVQNCGLTGTIDISMFTSMQSGAALYFYSNSGLTGITLPTGSIAVSQFLAASCSLGYIDFTGMTGLTNYNGCYIDLQNNGMSAAVVNHILVDLDSLSSAGYGSRNIQIGGTNAAPDTTSGGYDGAAAKTSLQGKGFTVVTS